MGHNFAVVKPKILKVPKITSFAILVKCDIMDFFENLAKQKKLLGGHS